MRLLSDRKGIQRTKVHPSLLTKPEEVCLRWEVCWWRVTCSVSGKEMGSRLVDAGTLLRRQTRLDVVKFFADAFSELAQHGRAAKREPCNALVVYAGIQLHTPVRRLARMLRALFPVLELAPSPVSRECSRGSFSTPLRSNSAASDLGWVALSSGHSAGIERRRIRFKVCYFRWEWYFVTCDPLPRPYIPSHPRFGTGNGTVIGCPRQTPRLETLRSEVNVHPAVSCI